MSSDSPVTCQMDSQQLMEITQEAWSSAVMKLILAAQPKMVGEPNHDRLKLPERRVPWHLSRFCVAGQVLVPPEGMRALLRPCWAQVAWYQFRPSANGDGQESGPFRSILDQPGGLC